MGCNLDKENKNAVNWNELVSESKRHGVADVYWCEKTRNIIYSIILFTASFFVFGLMFTLVIVVFGLVALVIYLLILLTVLTKGTDE